RVLICPQVIECTGTAPQPGVSIAPSALPPTKAGEFAERLKSSVSGLQNSGSAMIALARAPSQPPRSGEALTQIRFGPKKGLLPSQINGQPWLRLMMFSFTPKL